MTIERQIEKLNRKELWTLGAMLFVLGFSAAASSLVIGPVAFFQALLTVAAMLYIGRGLPDLERERIVLRLWQHDSVTPPPPPYTPTIVDDREYI